MKIHKDGTITNLTKLEKLEQKFWEEYYALPDIPTPDEFTCMTSEEQQVIVDECESALRAIHVKYKTHLWMPSKMKVHNE